MDIANIMQLAAAQCDGLVPGRNADLYRVRMIRDDLTHDFEFVLSRSLPAAVRLARKAARGRVIVTYSRWINHLGRFEVDGFKN